MFAILYAWFFSFKTFVNSVEVGVISLEEVMGLAGPLILVSYQRFGSHPLS